MGKTAVHQPHDKLFKATFSRTRNARAFFENYLPAQVVPTLDWKTLRRLSATFIHPGLKGSESDLLFSVRARGGGGVCYLLLEHQSTEDPYLALRMAGYVHGVLERHRREHPGKKMPRVLAVVLAQGKGPWRSPSNPADIFPWEEET
jgi:predicted transposase/invertase (TIGR01784 family)